MIIAIVQVPGVSRTKEQAIASAEAGIARFTKVPGLITKYFLNGSAGGGGVYIWESRGHAERWYNADWEANIMSRFGVKPTITYYDSYVKLDNAARRLLVDGAEVAYPA